MAQASGSEIHVATIDTGEDRRLTQTGKACVAPSYAPAGKTRIAFIEERTPKEHVISVVDPAGKTVAQTSVGPTRAFVWDLSGAAIFAGVLARTREKLVVWDLGEKQEGGVELKKTDQTSLAMGSQKEMAWVSGTDPVTRITGLIKVTRFGVGGRWSMTLRVPGVWCSLAVHPVSGIVHALRQDGDRWDLASEGKPRQPLEFLFHSVHPAPVSRTQLSWAPDGKLLAFLHDGEVHVIAEGGGEPRRVSPEGSGECGPPVWHPSGSSVGYVRGTELHLVDVASGKDRVVPNVAVRDPRFAFSPDGASLAYAGG